MMRMDHDRTRAVRAWLAAGSDGLSPRVRDNVLHEFPLTSQDRPYWAAPWLQTSSFAVGAAAGAAAVTLAVAMLGAGLFGGIRPGGAGATPTSTPDAPSPTVAPSATPNTLDRSYRDVGFIGLPPPGATPSDPTHTELIEVFWRPVPPYKGAAFLYADGRLIWNEYFGEANSRSTGWLEQSLTDEGMELVRALATEAQFKGQRLRILSPEELPGLLPARAWVDQAVRPYVPSGYAACLFVTEEENPFTESDMTPEEMVAALPRAAADLLGDRPPVVDSSNSYGADSACLELDVADARRLDRALRAAGYEQDGWRNRYLLQDYAELDRPQAGTWWLEVWFEPILPDGTITCSSCG
jgi:hypothetical protein